MQTEMKASVRELRHMVGRYLHSVRLPAYGVNSIRDAILLAQADGYDAVSDMERRRDAFAAARTSFDVNGTALDGRGSPLVALAPALVDEILLALAAAQGDAHIALVVRNVLDPEIITALHSYASIRGVAYESRVGNGEVEIRAWKTQPPPALPACSAAGAGMEAALRDGYTFEIEQFWRLFHESNLALTPDSELSRQHAGSQIRNERGEVIGEGHEETYDYIRSQAAANDRTEERVSS